MGSAPATENALDDAGGRKGRPYEQRALGRAGGSGTRPYKTGVAGLGGRLGPLPLSGGHFPPAGGNGRRPIGGGKMGEAQRGQGSAAPTQGAHWDGRAGLGPAPTGRGQSGSARRSRLRSPSATNSCPSPHIRRAGAESRILIYIFWKLQHNCLLKQKSASRSGGASACQKALLQGVPSSAGDGIK